LKITECPITHSDKSIIFADLGVMPIVNNLLQTKTESCKKYPLSAQYFPESGLSCLTHIIPPEELFTNYTYKSGVSKAYAEHCLELFFNIDEYIDLEPNDNVLDIGGNDGTLLRECLRVWPGVNVLNVDASKNMTELSIKQGIPAINLFWDHITAVTLDRKFKLITSTNVFQHTIFIDSFVGAVNIALQPGGLWCLEFPYFKTTLETGQFDQIYHEHVYYYLITPLVKLFKKHNLHIIQAIPQEIHGGSMRLLVGRCGEWEKEPTIQGYINAESKLTSEYYLNWGERIKDKVSESQMLLLSLKLAGKNIAGFGAAAKGCVFLNTAKIDYKTIDVVIDDTDLKQGKFIPGTGIEIVSREYLETNKPDYILILAHNFEKQIRESLKNQFNGEYIILFPKVRVI